MLTKTDFTAEEWNVIRRAPLMAGLVVVAASPSGPIGVVKEMFAVGKTLADVKLHGASSDLVKAVVADLETAEARQQSTPAELQGKAPDQVRTAALEACRQAVAMIEKKAKPDEAQAFKQWLASVGQKVAEAAKEGGILGFGGTRVSEQETSALKDLTSVLGVKV
jgi:ABC-type phosphate transport system substrate-binding protein